MPTRHQVLEGEGTTSIAEEYGFYDRTIWSHPDNEELRKHRRDMNALLPGDELVIPDKRIKEVQRATGALYTFRLRGVPAKYRVQLVSRGEPIAGRPYVLTVDDAHELSGKTDSQGVIEVFVPAGSQSGVLRVDRSPDAEDLVVQIAFGRVDPVEEISGVQKRLNNMGYNCGTPDGALNESTRAAIHLFQRRQELPETGELDNTTRELIARLHDTRQIKGPNQTPL
jgi:peptidoglycan hydrolase-like protein with peptidoglycan-binding domain